MIKMNSYKLSVIVPTFNSGKFLCNLFDSLLGQTIGFENIEVIFVDDASSDSYTLDLIESLVSKYSNCRAIFLKDNSGFPGKPRNIGIDKSKSDYVIVADHDDSYEKNTLEILYDNINENNADVVISNFNQVYNDNIIPYKSSYKKNTEILDISKNKEILGISAAIWTRLFRKDFLVKNNIKFLEGMLAEDVYFACNTSLNASKIIYLAEFYGYNYYIRDSEDNKSTIHIRNKKYLEAILNGYYEIVKMLKNQKKLEYSDYIFKSHLTSWLYTIVISEINDEDKKELFSKCKPLYNEYYVDDPYFEGNYENLVNFIKNNELDLAINEVNKLKSSQKNINSYLNENKYKRLFKSLKNKLKS
ncbi:glycosyltransferase family 2 protein [Methanobrevibacter sp. DSM 116169]|uniref:glycosyltransferase family 2 protein n=1 Tax=Methanobrevibacter sp. DSM 116169 TaxID=3242727 RepID=UPI0038FD3557